MRRVRLHRETAGIVREEGSTEGRWERDGNTSLTCVPDRIFVLYCFGVGSDQGLTQSTCLVLTSVHTFRLLFPRFAAMP